MGRRSFSLAVGLLTLLGGAAFWKHCQNHDLSDALADHILHEGMEAEDQRASLTEYDAVDRRLASRARRLLDQGAESDSPNPSFPAHYLAVRYEFPRTLQVLLDAGADPNRSPDRLPTLLSVARRSGNRKIIQMLKQAGARE